MENNFIITREECRGDYPGMEYHIISKHYGLPNSYWQLVKQTYRKEAGKNIDVLTIRIIKDKETKKILETPIQMDITFELK